MKTIKRIEMANDNDVYTITTGERLKIVASGEFFEIYEGTECVCDDCRSERDAIEWAAEWATNDGKQIVTGYGIYSGRKFWQLPVSIQKNVLRLAGFGGGV